MKSDEPGLPPFVPRAGIYLRRGTFYIVSEDRSVTGFRYIGDTVLTLPEEAGDAEIAAALLEALSAGRDGIPHRSWEDSQAREGQEALLQAAGVKRWSTLHTNCRACSVASYSDKMEFIPLRLRGSSAEGISEDVFSIPPDSAPEEIGRAVRTCLSRSR